MCVDLLRVGAFPIGRARSDQQLASSETHARALAGCILASLIFILMAYVFAFWFPPRGHDGGMPTSAKRQSACTRTCLCASSTEARLGPIRVPGRSSSRSDVFLCIPNARPRSSHTGDAAALQTWPKYSSGGARRARGIRDNAASRPRYCKACGSYSAAAERSDGYKQGSAFFVMTPFRHNVFSRMFKWWIVGAPT